MKILYNMRWGIETSFRKMKYTVGLLRFHAKKVEHIYEVSLLADRFGANAIPVLEVPLVPMFDGDTGVQSKYMKQAIRRGVCFWAKNALKQTRLPSV